MGVALYRWTYDLKGNKMEELHYNDEERPSENNQGIASYSWEYDEEE